LNKNINPIVPVLMYHSIADHKESKYAYLSTPVNIFNMMISYLFEHRYNTITLDELYNYLSTGERLPPKPIVITFDDGYLDNWVNAFPILKKHGMKATVFVVPEFVDPTAELRPTLYDVWKGRMREVELLRQGFLSWDEMKEMSRSGLIDIQSHSLTHTYCFQGFDIVDFHHPGDNYPWLAWNKEPSRKYLWPIEYQEEFVEYGSPIYTYGRALARPQYSADESLGKALEEYVKNHGGRNFFSNSGWKECLLNIVNDYRRSNSSRAGYESFNEYEERVVKELTLSKEIIEKNIGKQVNFLCWPGGVFNETTIRIAQEAGYLATSKGESRNARGVDHRRFDRLSGDVRLSRIHPLVDKYAARLLFTARVEAYQGKPGYSILLSAALKTVRLCRRLLTFPAASRAKMMPTSLRAMKR
jgi:peptidoglycan/xylan/chitin deacetylase (PgdA/CDA1 family)